MADDFTEEERGRAAGSLAGEDASETAARVARRKNLTKNMVKALRDEDPDAGREVDETAADAILPDTARKIRRHNKSLDDALNTDN